jgi:sugar O-acyltransferase (sialic acid O-acetyltransferase NeuD family)
MFLIGASGHAKVILDAMECAGIPVEGVFDRNEALQRCLEYAVKPCFHFQPSIEKELIIAIGHIDVRKRLAGEFGNRVSWGKVIHPSALISKYSSVGNGSVVMAGAVVQVNVKIGEHVIINTKASIDHDSEIGDFTHIAPQAVLCGNIKIGAECLIGAGSVLTPGVTVGENCIVGAGSVVLRNIRDGEKVYGIVK